MPNKVYLDYAATTPIDPKVLRAMLPFLKKEFGNPSSIHSFGQKALFAIDDARQKAADFLGCGPQEIFFTGSATEANNLALVGAVKAFNEKNRGKKLHIITTRIEHHAIFEPCESLERAGVEVTYLPVDKEGLVSLSALERAIKDTTILVSIMYANNEIGVIQPISEIGELIGKINAARQKSDTHSTGRSTQRASRSGSETLQGRMTDSMSSGQAQNESPKILFHTDAVQAVNYLDCNVEKLGVDLLTLSSHKIYGPKGVGALYVKKGAPIIPMIRGGGQEGGLRSGTENVAGIVGLGAAIQEIQNPKNKIHNIKIRQLRDKLIKGILKLVPNSQLNGSLQHRLPNNVNISFKGAEGESIVIALDQKGIAASTGSACSSRALEPSHVLLALGLSHEEAHGSLRLTLGKYTTQQDIERVFRVLPPIIERLRKISGIR